jgi:hypothetical protein
MVSESNVQAQCRVRAAELGWRLWRNNVGAGKLDNGSFVRWGLANESAAVNKLLKSSDLIGLDDAGRFVAVECKHEGWKYNPSDEREAAQNLFHEIVRAHRGRAGFVTHPDQLATL